MGRKIIICGLNGAGKSTLGRLLAEKTEYAFADIEDYYFPQKNVYENARDEDEVSRLLLSDMLKNDNFIFSAVRGNYSAETEKLFTHAVLLKVPKFVRMERIRQRSYEKFGKRGFKGGDLYEEEKSFFDKAESRPENLTELWLNKLDIPTITVDGTQPVEQSIKAVMNFLTK